MVLRLFTIFGNSNTGKTETILKIAKKLKKKGYKISYLKNSSKDYFDFEKDEKDTGKLKEANVILGRAKLEFFMRIPILENILKDVVIGFLRNLKGYEESGDVEVKIKR